MLFGTKCTLKFGYYDNKTIAITAIRISDRERLYVATVNYEEQFQGKSYKKQLGFPQVVIKNYSENKGIYQQLIDAGVITIGVYLSGSGGTVQSGRLTDEWQRIAKIHLPKIK